MDGGVQLNSAQLIKQNDYPANLKIDTNNPPENFLPNLPTHPLKFGSMLVETRLGQSSKEYLPMKKARF